MFNRDQAGIRPFVDRLWLSSPVMHGEELEYMTQAFRTNWMSTVGENIDVIERDMADKTGRRYAVALATGTAALHLAVRLAGEKLYGSGETGGGNLRGHKVFCSDLTFVATVNPVTYEGGVPVFVDTERDTWNMDPAALEKAFERYPDVRLVVLAHLYGTPARMDEIREIVNKYGALLVEDAAESLGAVYKGSQTGTFGDSACISFNGNKIITGSSGGMFLTDSLQDADKIRKWATQSREKAGWYQHEETGYNYRMSNVIAGVVRGQIPYLEEHISRKKVVYERYREGFRGLPVSMNPYNGETSSPNFWLSCLLVDRDAMCRQVRSGTESFYIKENGRSCPSEILEALECINAEGRPIWKPMHMQPQYQTNPFITRCGNGRTDKNAGQQASDAGRDIFSRGLCLPCDIKMSSEQQDMVIETVRRCFD